MRGGAWLAFGLGLALVTGCGGGGPAADARRDADARETATPRQDAADSGRPDGAGHDADADDGRAADPRDGARETPLADGPPGEPPPPPPYCQTARAVPLGGAPVAGTFGATSNNSAVTCHGGVTSFGPDTFFTLEIAEAQTVELTTNASVDTVIAIRSSCRDGFTELACGELPPRSEADAGADGGDAAADGGDAAADGDDATGGGAAVPPHPGAGLDGNVPAARLTSLRRRLLPGTYTIVVDTFLFPPAGSRDFTLAARAIPLAANATCATPFTLAAGATVRDQELELGGPSTASCAAGAASSLYYAVSVPPGYRLTARATPSLGDRAWMPRLAAFSSCATPTCAAQGHVVSGTTQQLDWTNNTTTTQPLLLSVSADAAVSGAELLLSVAVVDQLASCTKPTAVTDGLVLFSQDIGLAPAPRSPSCAPATTHATYYSVTLLPQQELTVTATGVDPDTNQDEAVVFIRTSCATASCAGGSQNETYKNRSSGNESVIVEVVPGGGLGSTVDLRFDLPLPPPAVLVRPPAHPVTTEAGGQATFDVVLASPPTAPVTVTVASDAPGEGRASPATLRFEPATWNVAQTVTVTGVDDQAHDGPRAYTVVTSAASADTRYDKLDVEDVELTNEDDETGLALVGAERLATSESGAKATFGVRLNRKPTANVRVPLTSSDVGEGTVSPAELTFSPTDWDQPQTVTLTGVDDVTFDGAQVYTVVTGAFVSGDASYGGFDPPDVPVHNRDDDYHAVTSTLVSGARSCVSSTTKRQIDVDGFGTMYIALLCDAFVSVMTSTDGGATFVETPHFPGSEGATEIVLAAGAGGIAHVVYETPDGLVYARTHDGGATWSRARTLLPSSTEPRLAVSGDAVAVLAVDADNSEHTMMMWSSNGGQSFGAQTAIDGALSAVALADGGATLWFLTLTEVRKSVDGGKTFTPVRALIDQNGLHAFGPRTFAALAPSELQRFTLADPAGTSQVIELSIGMPLAAVLDEADVLTILALDDNTGRLGAYRLAQGVDDVGTVKVLGLHAEMASAVALSRKAVATLYLASNLQLFAVATWP